SRRYVSLCRDYVELAASFQHRTTPYWVYRESPATETAMPQIRPIARAGAAPARVVVLGAGKIGRTIAAMLHASADYAVTLVDCEAARLPGLPAGVAVRVANPREPQVCAEILSGVDAVLNALPFHAAVAVATVAAR